MYIYTYFQTSFPITDRKTTSGSLFPSIASCSLDPRLLSYDSRGADPTHSLLGAQMFPFDLSRRSLLRLSAFSVGMLHKPGVRLRFPGPAASFISLCCELQPSYCPQTLRNASPATLWDRWCELKTIAWGTCRPNLLFISHGSFSSCPCRFENLLLHIFCGAVAGLIFAGDDGYCFLIIHMDF